MSSNNTLRYIRFDLTERKHYKYWHELMILYVEVIANDDNIGDLPNATYRK